MWTGPELPYLPIRACGLVDKLTSLMIKGKSKQNSATSMEETGQHNVKGN